jgi:hypothetical protein
MQKLKNALEKAYVLYNVTKCTVFNTVILSNLPEERFKVTVFTLSEMGDFRVSRGEI